MAQGGTTGEAACLRCGGPLRSMGIERFRVGGTSGGWKLLFGELAEVSEQVLGLEVLACGRCRRVELRAPGEPEARGPFQGPDPISEFVSPNPTSVKPETPVMPAAPTAPQPPVDEGYAGGMKAGATLLTIFAPFIALIAALIMLGNERSPLKRAFLRSWAWLSGAFLVVALFIGIAIVASVANNGSHTSDSGPCIGGPILGEPGVQVGPNRFRFRCDGGGSSVVDFSSPTP